MLNQHFYNDSIKSHYQTKNNKKEKRRTIPKYKSFTQGERPPKTKNKRKLIDTKKTQIKISLYNTNASNII